MFCEKKWVLLGCLFFCCGEVWIRMCNVLLVWLISVILCGLGYRSCCCIFVVVVVGSCWFCWWVGCRCIGFGCLCCCS